MMVQHGKREIWFKIMISYSKLGSCSHLRLGLVLLLKKILFRMLILILKVFLRFWLGIVLWFWIGFLWNKILADVLLVDDSFCRSLESSWLSEKDGRNDPQAAQPTPDYHWQRLLPFRHHRGNNCEETCENIDHSEGSACNVDREEERHAQIA